MLLKRGMSGQMIAALQQGLEDIGYELGTVDGAFGAKTDAAVRDFQSKNGLSVDGCAGDKTINALNDKLNAAGKEDIEFDDQTEEADVATLPSANLKWVNCLADKVSGKDGFTRTTLRSDAAAAYNQFLAAVHALGGVITSAGGRRALNSGAGKARSKKSMHYVGLAFDMSLATGMQDVNTDPFLVVKDADRKWTIWCKTNNSNVPMVTLDAVTCQTRHGVTTLTTTKMNVRAFNFTDLAKQHGFARISARSSFLSGGSYSGAEWWHFQWNAGLVSGKSKFGDELLKIYPAAEAQKFIYWNEVKNSVFGVDWF